MARITLPVGCSRIVLADAFRLILEASKGGVDVFVDDEGNPELRRYGTWAMESELTDDFLEFCRTQGVAPVNPVKPWSASYTGAGLENGLFEINVADFRRFAEGYGFEVIEESALSPYVQQSEEKHKAGRYTLEEAAQRLEAEAGERANLMLNKLMAAAESGDLLVFGPGENARYLYGPGHATRVREFYEEAFWNELNDWLVKHEPRITWRFPDPSEKTATDASSRSANRSGVPSAVIIEKFHLGSEWDNRLRHRKSYSYLKPPVLAQPGAKGNGRGKNLWNPAQFAKMLMDEHGKKLTAMDAIMKNSKNHFDDWLDEWHEISGWDDV